jgi:hypothetical protein
MRTVLSLDACMVIVTSPANASLFHGRDPMYTHIVEVNLQEQGGRFNRSIEFWEGQFRMDDEASIHKGYQLYWVWALKPVLLADAIGRNIFGSDYFFWIDVGCQRSDENFGRSLRTAPPQVRSSNRVFFANIFNFTREDLVVRPDGTAESLYIPDRLAGAVWGGRATAVLAFRDSYFRVFNRLTDIGRFVGKDQTIMNIACVENAPDLCAMVRPKERYNPWFYMVPFLLGDTPSDVPYTLSVETTSDHN